MGVKMRLRGRSLPGWDAWKPKEERTTSSKWCSCDTTTTNSHTDADVSSRVHPDQAHLRTRTDFIPVILVYQLFHLGFILFTFTSIIQRMVSILVRIVVALFVVALLLFIPDCGRVVERRGVPEEPSRTISPEGRVTSMSSIRTMYPSLLSLDRSKFEIILQALARRTSSPWSMPLGSARTPEPSIIVTYFSLLRRISFELRSREVSSLG